MDCGRTFPAFVMDFDHRDGKQFEIGTGQARGYGIKTLVAEIAKCDLVCSNCHRIRTFARR